MVGTEQILLALYGRAICLLLIRCLTLFLTYVNNYKAVYDICQYPFSLPSSFYSLNFAVPLPGLNNITGPSPASYNVLCMLKALARGNRHFILTELKIMAPP